MKTILAICLLLLGTLLQAANIKSAASGDFFSTSTWQGGVVPGAGDDVTIQGGHLITMNLVSDYTINSITYKYDGDMNVTTTDPAYSLTVTGDFKIGNGAVDVDLQANVQAGSITYSGGSNSTIVINSGYVMTTPGALTFASGPHDIDVYGTLNIGSATLSGGSNRINIYPGGVVNVTNGVTFTGSAGLDVNNAGTMNVGGDVTMGGGSTMDIEGTVDVAGDFNLTNGTVNVDGLLEVDGTLDLGWNTITGDGEISAGDIDCGSGSNCEDNIGPVVLPIELTCFKAKEELNLINVQWTTATEEDNDFFTLERSYDAKNFESVAVIEGAGNSYEAISYNYKDYFYNKDQAVYYRLKQTDYNGVYSYSEIIAVNDAEYTNTLEGVAIEWNINNISLQFSEDLNGLSANLYNVKGQLIKYWKLNSIAAGQEVNFGLDGKNSTIYILEIQSENKRMTQKIMNF
jgi:hypothetical protein